MVGFLEMIFHDENRLVERYVKGRGLIWECQKTVDFDRSTSDHVARIFFC